MTQPHIHDQAAARDRQAAQMGTVDTDLLVPLINPSFRGGPQWPALRQAWRTVQRNSNTLLLSDGLSDPFAHEPWPNAGFGIELLVETADRLEPPIQNSWLFSLIDEISQQAANSGDFRDKLERLTLFSMDFPPPQGLESLADEEGYVGVLMGLPAPDDSLDWDTPGGSVRVITAKLLHPRELAFIIREGREGRTELAKRFASDGTRHLSSLTRSAVV